LKQSDLSERVSTWLTRLVQIPSVSPAQAGVRAGEPGEGRLAAAVANWFAQFGGEVHQQEVYPGRPNIFGIWRGNSDRWLGVDIHLDTVSVESMSGDPFSGHVADGRVYGRGAVDTKATLAIVLALLEELTERGQRPATNLLIAATVDEEVGALGAPASAAWLQERGLFLDELLVAEPTGCAPIYGHKGVVRLHFTIQGLAAHSSQPHLGKNAVVAAAQLICALQAEHERLQALPAAALGHAALTVTIVQGGTGINVVPDQCTLSLDRRVVEQESAAEVVAQLAELAQSACPLPISMEVEKQINAFFQSTDSSLVIQLANWAGEAPQSAPYGTNAWAYAPVAKQRVVFGPGSIDQAHAAEEWVTLAELARAAEIYRRWWGIAPE
jgi:acetylornithine deacetylase/succinyl-diaminopimelate desuccinylase-like protein